MHRVDETVRLEAIERLMDRGAALPRRRVGADGGTRRRAEAERFLEFSAAHAINIDAMWVRRDAQGAVTSTVLAVPNPGRTAILFSSTPTGVAEVEDLSDLIRFASRELGAMDVDLAQVLLDPQDALQRQAFIAGGFQMLARLSYMERPVPRPGKTRCPEPPPGVTVEPYRDAVMPEVLTVLEASYEETLDCPGLRGLRRTEDILAGHRGTGRFEADLWTVLRIDGDARGVALLNPSPGSNTIELVYIGLARGAQKRGLGEFLLRRGLTQIAGRPERAVTLAVDDQNSPAIALYRALGFRRVLRRVALIRPVRDTP